MHLLSELQCPHLLIIQPQGLHNDVPLPLVPAPAQWQTLWWLWTLFPALFQQLALSITKYKEPQDCKLKDPQLLIQNRPTPLEALSHPHQAIDSSAHFPTETQELAHGPSELAAGFPLPIHHSAGTKPARMHADLPETTDACHMVLGAAEAIPNSL